MSFRITEYTSSQRKQIINARHGYEHYLLRVKEYARHYRQSMYWRTSKGRRYLTRKHSRRSKVVSLGVESPRTRVIYEEFTARKTALKEEIATLKIQQDKTRKLNKIEQLSRVPDPLIAIYRKINELGLEEKILLIGTNALYAYEAYCGVFVEEDQLATGDIDLLNKPTKELSVLFDTAIPEGKLTDLIREIDRTFEPDPKAPYRFRNREGVLLEVITPAVHDTRSGTKVGARFADILSLEMAGMHWIENSRIFRSFVIGQTGECAILSTIHPLEFAVYKHWLSHRPDRAPLKRTRDAEQSRLITRLIRDYMVDINISRELENMKHFKKEVIDRYTSEVLPHV